MEDQAASLLATLKKSSSSIDAKITQFNNVKSSIKHQRVPEGAQPTIFECIRLAIGAQTSSTLVSTGFSALTHLIKRLSLQNQTAIISSQCPKLLPILLDRLGDARESHRNAASQSLVDLWPYNHAGVEGIIREGALGGTNSRAKEAAMQWVVKMHNDEGLPFKSFVPYLVANLEDSDGGVRETAKSAVVDLFRNAPEHAKTNLKKQLNSHGVRKTIASYIIANLGLPVSTIDVDLKASTPSVSTTSTSHLMPDTGIADSLGPEHPPLVEAVQMDPIYVYTQRELDETFRDMAPHFEGRETEQNWLPRDKSITKLRRIAKGNAPQEYQVAFVAGVRSMLDGIIKVSSSLRTTMSTNGCQLVQELARTLGPAMDPMVELLLQTFIKMSANTKTISAQNGNVTVDTIFQHVSYTTRNMQHVQFAVSDKNVQPRTFAAGWLKTLIKRNAQHKGHFEHSGGLDNAIKCIQKGLSDANPKVRESFRGTYWTLAKIWPDRAEAIMEGLDAKQQSLLQKDSNNPNATAGASAAGAKGPTSKLKSQASRTSLKETIAAQRKAQLAAKKMPDRPSSAQSAFSPVKSGSSTSLTDRGANLSKSQTMPRPPSGLGRPALTSSTSAASNGGSLMSKPVRRPRMAPRPQTADPYASRNKNAQQTETPSMSPVNSPDKGTAKKTDTLKRSVGPRSAVKDTSISPVRPKSRLGEVSHRKTPSVESPTANLSNNEDLTMVMPFRQRPTVEKTASVDSGVAQLNEEDGFTMVIPSMKLSHSENERLASPQTSPSKIPSPRGSTPRKSIDLGLGSPIANIKALVQNRSPKPKSPERSVTDPIVGEEVKVYEDPFVGQEGEAAQPSEDGKPVLEELPLNEQNRDRHESSDGLQGDQEDAKEKAATNGATNGEEIVQDRAEVLRTRRLLASGIERIRAKTLDAHGFRRLQDLVKGDMDVWGERDERFSDLLYALLEYLETPNEVLKAPNIKAQNLKTQVLGTIRAMLTLHRKKSAPYYGRALCGILCARAQWDSASHISTELEKTADEIIKYGEPDACVAAVIDLLDASSTMPVPGSPSSAISASSTPSRPSSATTPNPRTTTLSLQTLSNLLQGSDAKSFPISESQASQLGKLAVKFLGSLDPDVRRADMEFCVQLHERLGGEQDGGFWKAVSGADKGHINLITYYLARKKKA